MTDDDTSNLAALLAPGSRVLSHHYLGPAAYTARFGASQAAVS
jgi:hypothetical protein